MSNHSLYDEDILLWSEQQAEVIRRLGRARRELSNELDIDNVAEEIESVGRSELAAVLSFIRLILVHLIKLFVESNSESARHWRSEIVAFHAEMLSRYAPSMRQRTDLDDVWRSAREQLTLAYEGERQERVANLSSRCPVTLDDLFGERIESLILVERLEKGIQARP